MTFTCGCTVIDLEGLPSLGWTVLTLSPAPTAPRVGALTGGGDEINRRNWRQALEYLRCEA
jgi:hypothetical protein